MKFSAWLKQNGIKRIDMAARLGLSPGAITLLCNNDASWLSRETAEAIFQQTAGAVTPNDFLGLGPLKGSTFMPQAVTDAIEAIALGQIVIVTDDDDRENEGDLVMAASLCTPEKMAFIIRNTCGIVCTPLPADEARRLRFDPMVASNDTMHGTAFTVTVDYKHGTTTGISADDRTATVRGMANPNAGAADFSRPGHIFPLIAKEGGVLMRSGHTEAAVDLCKLAGVPPVGVICELVNDDGTVMKGQQINAFAQKHGLKQITVAELIAYRQAREKLVERVATFPVETEHGPVTGHAYVTPFDSVQHFAFVMGRIGDGKRVPVRLHRADVIADTLGGAKSIHAALARFARDGKGVLVYLRDGTAGVPTNAVRSGETAHESARVKQWREVGLGAQILRDLGIESIVNLSSTSRAFVGLTGFGIEIADTQAVDRQ
ncbi:MAG: 3,4-dihydroxy-2-butanone-4-phosphate synthase [Bosea sp. (in: a-proteobacteria)]